jgi:hypothetical protein
MANKLDAEARMTIRTLAERGHTNRAITRLLGVHENAVRYHRRRQTEGAVDGRGRQQHLAESFGPAITHWLEQVDGGGPLNLAALYDWLVREHGYPGSARSLQRYFRAHYPRPRIRARRRVETPPGAQAQADWGEYPDVRVAGRCRRLSVFALKLSWSRYRAFIWSPRQDQLAWHRVHNEAFRRIDGIPAVVRIDNLKTGMARGAGPWGEINRHYRAYARSVGFHIDACLPRSDLFSGFPDRGIEEPRGSSVRFAEPVVSHNVCPEINHVLIMEAKENPFSHRTRTQNSRVVPTEERER